MNKNILVTGGAGYIGSHFCKAINGKGFVPVSLDNLINGWKDAVKFGPLEKCNLLNRSAVDQVFKKYNPIAVIHFAALSQVEESMRSPGKYWKNNVLGSLNLIESAVKHNCMNFIFSSTCATYGNQDNVILDERSKQAPINAYGASKLAVEKILANFDLAFGLKHVIFRYFNVAGADPGGDIGEFHNPETHLIPLLLDTISGKRGPLKIYGTDYDTPDGTCIRDFVHVCDIVDAHILGLDWLQKRAGSRVFNLGTGKGFSVRQVINEAKVVTNKSVPTIESNRRSGDCAKLVSGSSLAISELGWKTNRSNLKQIITDSWRWHQNGFYFE